MMNLNRIETELNSIDGAKFHSLCNLFLEKEGYKHLNAVGLAVGIENWNTGYASFFVKWIKH